VDEEVQKEKVKWVNMKICKEGDEWWWVLRGDCIWKGESNYKGNAAVSG
jgi:hypothetical protein